MPAATIRLVRKFHSFTRDQFAEVFEVSLRTVFRWESEGVDPDSLALDPGARSGPDWRRKYMNWLLERFNAFHVSDTRKKQQEVDPCSTISTPTPTSGSARSS